MSRKVPVVLPRLLAALLCMPCLPGQVTAPTPQQPGRAEPVPPESPTTSPTVTRTGDPDIDALTPVWQQPLRPAPFQGFPVFPPTLPGYGNYPKTPRSLAELFADIRPGEIVPVPVAQAPSPTGWPAWLKLEDKEPLPYEPGLALLVRKADRVWWRDIGEEAFVPLESYDKLRPAAADVEVEVRGTGQFELLFHGGSRLVARGPTRLRIERLDEEIVGLRLAELTAVRLEAFGREHRLTLPDGSVVAVAASAPPPAAEPGLPGFGALLPGLETSTAPVWSPALVVIDRVDEPRWRAGRATVWNGGGLDVEWRHAFGTVTIAPNQRVTFFFEGARDPVPAAFGGDGVVLEQQGRTARATVPGGGALSWCGARFVLPDGASVRFDAGLGAPFGPAGAGAARDGQPPQR